MHHLQTTFRIAFPRHNKSKRDAEIPLQPEPWHPIPTLLHSTCPPCRPLLAPPASPLPPAGMVFSGRRREELNSTSRASPKQNQETRNCLEVTEAAVPRAAGTRSAAQAAVLARTKNWCQLPAMCGAWITGSRSVPGPNGAVIACPPPQLTPPKSPFWVVLWKNRRKNFSSWCWGCSRTEGHCDGQS